MNPLSRFFRSAMFHRILIRLIAQTVQVLFYEFHCIMGLFVFQYKILHLQIFLCFPVRDRKRRANIRQIKLPVFHSSFSPMLPFSMSKHLLNKHPIPFRRVRYKHMRHGPDDFSILQDRAAAHECVKERTTNFDKLFQFLAG